MGIAEKVFKISATASQNLNYLNDIVLAAAASVCVIRQSETKSHRFCEAQTLGNSSSVAGYSSMQTAGGVSDRLTEGVQYK